MKTLLTSLPVIAIMLTSALAAPTTPTATLKAPTAFPLTMNGKQVGTTKLPAGTKVEILQEDPAAGKALVKANIGQAWVTASEIEKSAQETPEAAAPVQNETVTDQTPDPISAPTPTPAPSVPSAPAATKKVLMWGAYRDEMGALAEEKLKSMGYTVDACSPSGDLRTIQDGETKKKDSVRVLKSKELIAAGRDYDIVWLIGPSASSRTTVAAIKTLNGKAARLNEKTKVVIVSDCPKDLVTAMVRGDQKKAESLFEDYTAYKIVPNPADPDEQLVKWVEPNYGPKLQTTTEFGKIENTIYFVKNPALPNKSDTQSDIQRQKKERGIDQLEDFITVKLPQLVQQPD